MTGGTDRVIRLWDLTSPEDSYRMSSDDIGSLDLRYNARLENNTVRTSCFSRTLLMGSLRLWWMRSCQPQ